ARELARALRRRLVAPMLAGEETAGERAPHQDAEALVERDRYQLVFRLARLQRVVDLLAYEALAMLALADAERLHEMPAGIVRAADIADEAAPDQAVEGFQRFLQRRLAVPLMDLVEIDDVGAQPLQARLAGADQVIARQAAVVRPIARGETRLGRDQHAAL